MLLAVDLLASATEGLGQAQCFGALTHGRGDGEALACLLAPDLVMCQCPCIM